MTATATTLATILPQLSTDLQRRTARHLAERPGFSTTDRIFSEMFGHSAQGIDRARRAATRRELTGATRRLHALGLVRYDAQYGGWWVR